MAVFADHNPLLNRAMWPSVLDNGTAGCCCNATLSLQGVIVGLAALNAVLAALWRPIDDPIYTIFDSVTATGELMLVTAMLLQLTGANVPVEFLLTVSFAIITCNAGKQVRSLDFLAASRADLLNRCSMPCVCSAFSACRFRMCSSTGWQYSSDRPTRCSGSSIRTDASIARLCGGSTGAPS